MCAFAARRLEPPRPRRHSGQAGGMRESVAITRRFTAFHFRRPVQGARWELNPRRLGSHPRLTTNGNPCPAEVAGFEPDAKRFWRPLDTTCAHLYVFFR